MILRDPTEQEIHDRISRLAYDLWQDNQQSSSEENWQVATNLFWASCIINEFRLSEDFIVNNIDKFRDLTCLAYNQYIPESIYHKFKINDLIYQNLSNDFIISNKISKLNFQNIPEQLIDADSLDIHYMVKHQKLSHATQEKLIKDKHWQWVIMYQKLSDDLILYLLESSASSRKFIFRYQKVNESLKQEYQACTFSWLDHEKPLKLDLIKESGLYEIVNDEYIIAYKTTDIGCRSIFNKRYRYEPGRTYECGNCDCWLTNENSFGLSAWTREEAIKYGAYNNLGNSNTRLFKLRIDIDDVGVLLNSGKIRCFKQTVLEEEQI